LVGFGDWFHGRPGIANSAATFHNILSYYCGDYINNQVARKIS